MLRKLNKFFLLGMALAILVTTAVWAQAIFATLTGVVTDPSGAVVPNANVTLRNADSGDVRQTVTTIRVTTPSRRCRSALTTSQ